MQGVKPDKNEIPMPVYPSPEAHRGTEALTRIQRIIEVAHRMLDERGYYDMSLDAILKESGGSKATLRKYFGNKAGLLGYLLKDTAERCVRDAEAAARDQSDPTAALGAFAGVALRFFCRPDALGVYRAVIAEAKRTPSIGQWFYYGGYGAFIATLARLLQEWQDRGSLTGTDVNGDAERFLFMLRSGPHDRALLGIIDHVSEADIDRHVDACVNIFLHGLGRDASV